MKRNQSCEPRLHVQADAESVHVCECTVSMCARARTHTRTHAQTQTHPCMHTYNQPTIHSYIHTHIRTFIHTFIHTDMRTTHTYMLFITYRNDTPLTATRVDENQCSGAGLRTGPALPMPVTRRSDTEEIQQHRMGLKLVSPRVEPIAGIQAGLRCSDLLAALRFRIRNSRNGHPQFPCRKKELACLGSSHLATVVKPCPTYTGRQARLSEPGDLRSLYCQV